VAMQIMSVPLLESESFKFASLGLLTVPRALPEAYLETTPPRGGKGEGAST
jgi:hypothetical protein